MEDLLLLGMIALTAFRVAASWAREAGAKNTSIRTAEVTRIMIGLR
jgi:hypothetical protein